MYFPSLNVPLTIERRESNRKLNRFDKMPQSTPKTRLLGFTADYKERLNQMAEQ